MKGMDNTLGRKSPYWHFQNNKILKRKYEKFLFTGELY